MNLITKSRYSLLFVLVITGGLAYLFWYRSHMLFQADPMSMVAARLFMVGQIFMLLAFLCVFTEGNRRNWWLIGGSRKRHTIWAFVGIWALLGLSYANAWMLTWSPLLDPLPTILRIVVPWIMTPLLVLYTVIWGVNRWRNRNSTELEVMSFRNGPHGT